LRRCGAGDQLADPPPTDGAPMNTRTIAILALVIAVIVLVYLFAR
jgi:hypothetical protein